MWLWSHHSDLASYSSGKGRLLVLKHKVLTSLEKGGYRFSNTRFLLLWKREITGSQTQGSYFSGKGRLPVLKHKVLTYLEKGDYWFSNTRFLTRNYYCDSLLFDGLGAITTVTIMIGPNSKTITYIIIMNKLLWST